MDGISSWTGAAKPLFQLHLVQIHPKDGVFSLRLTGDTQTKQVPPLMRKSILYKVGHVDKGVFWGLCCTGISHAALACRQLEEVNSRLAIFFCPKNHLKGEHVCCWLFCFVLFFFPPSPPKTPLCV